MGYDFPSSLQQVRSISRAAVPPYGAEHFLPLFYALGAGNDLKKDTLLHRSYRYNNLSHSVWRFA